MRVPGEREIRTREKNFTHSFADLKTWTFFGSLESKKKGKTLSIATITATRSTGRCKDLEATRSGEDYGNGQ